MDREVFKIQAYGNYAYTHLSTTIDKDEMQKYVDGALWAYDFIRKMPKEQREFSVFYPQVVYQKPNLEDCHEKTFS